MKLKGIITAVASVLGAASLGAQTVDEARTLAEDGNMEEAVTMLRSIVDAGTKDAEIPRLLGDYCRALGDDTGASQAYTEARRMGDRNAILGLAALAADSYDVDAARELVEEYRKTLKKGRRVVADDESEPVTDFIDRIDNALARVEQIEVIDSMVVDADDFFRHYRLSPESGSLNPTNVLPQEFPAANPTVVYEPESGREMIWAAPSGNDGSFGLYSSSALYGDTWERPVALGDELSLGADANYPFLMPDGVTLYYASDGGDEGLGGLDIYISRRGDDGFLQPQNLGMPYNSPYDDYMLAIDELTGVGWWASDRNRIPGKVTIYIFIPQELRRNVPPDSPDLAARARLTSISATWSDHTDRSAILSSIAAISTDKQALAPQFHIYIPGRGVLTRFSEFRNPTAERAMHAYQVGLAKVTDAERRLAALRAEFAEGNSSLADTIVALEGQLEAARASLTDLRNAVVTAETD